MPSPLSERDADVRKVAHWQGKHNKPSLGDGILAVKGDHDGIRLSDDGIRLSDGRISGLRVGLWSVRIRIGIRASTSPPDVQSRG
jgi:hypothetical protein